jgi:hypothetical protein
MPLLDNTLFICMLVNIISPYIKDHNIAGSKNWGKCAITVFINQPKMEKKEEREI